MTHFYRLFSIATLTLLSSLSCFSMENSPLPRPISGEITDFAWTPRGTRIAVSSRNRKNLQFYNTALEHTDTLVTNQPIMKIAVASSQRRIALGLKNGDIEVYNLAALQEDCVSITTNKRTIHKLAWVGNSPYLLAYLKDPEPQVAGTNTYYAPVSTLQLYDGTTGNLTKEIVVPQHVLKLQIAPSGRLAAFVTNVQHRREDALTLESSPTRHCLNFANLAEDFSVEQNGTRQHIFDEPIKALEWSPDSASLAVLFESGNLTIFDPEGHIIEEFSLAACQRVTGSISWSQNGNLAIPGTLGTVEIEDPTHHKTIDSIRLEDYFTKVNPEKPVFATKIHWSKASPHLAVLCCDLGWGAATVNATLIIVPTHDLEQIVKRLKASNADILDIEENTNRELLS